VAEAIDKLTSFENFYLLVTVVEMVTGKELIPGTPNDIYKLIDYLRDYVSKNREELAEEYFDKDPDSVTLTDVIFQALKNSTLLGRAL